MIAHDPSIDCLFLIDGNLPESGLLFPPIEKIWNRWERGAFVENGKPCRMVLIEGLNVVKLRQK